MHIIDGAGHCNWVRPERKSINLNPGLHAGATFDFFAAAYIKNYLTNDD